MLLRVSTFVGGLAGSAVAGGTAEAQLDALSHLIGIVVAYAFQIALVRFFGWLAIDMWRLTADVSTAGFTQVATWFGGPGLARRHPRAAPPRPPRRRSPRSTAADAQGVESRLEAADLALSIVEPGIVYGHAAGVPASLADAPKDAGDRLTVIGLGTQHWPTVHVDDVADLYALIVESPSPASRVLALSGQNPTVAELGEAFAGGPVAPEGVDASRARLGAAYADALMLDQQGSGAKARSIGWAPSRPSLLERSGRGSTPPRPPTDPVPPAPPRGYARKDPRRRGTA
ncbi:hypothetical protein [Microbacterium lacticum]